MRMQSRYRTAGRLVQIAACLAIVAGCAATPPEPEYIAVTNNVVCPDTAIRGDCPKTHASVKRTPRGLLIAVEQCMAEVRAWTEAHAVCSKTIEAASLQAPTLRP